VGTQRWAWSWVRVALTRARLQPGPDLQRHPRRSGSGGQRIKGAIGAEARLELGGALAEIAVSRCSKQPSGWISGRCNVPEQGALIVTADKAGKGSGQSEQALVQQAEAKQALPEREISGHSLGIEAVPAAAKRTLLAPRWLW